MTATSDTYSLALTPGTWEYDQAHSQVGFTIRHLGISTLRGAFREVEAELVVGDTLENCSVRATAEMSSMDTGLSDRDERLLQPDLVDLEKWPRLEFESTSIEPAGDDYTMHGTLTIGEATAPIEFAVEFGGAQEFVMDGRVHAGFAARGHVKRSDYGIVFGRADAIVSDKVPIQLDLQFLAPAA